MSTFTDKHKSDLKQLLDPHAKAICDPPGTIVPLTQFTVNPALALVASAAK